MTDRFARPGFQHVVIVGGGTSGWMAATLLARSTAALGVRITVVEPPGSRGIGVGEASIPSLPALLRSLHADEADFLRRCDATWKLAIRFQDWNGPGTESWHPFGVCGARLDGRDLFHLWNAERLRTSSPRSYASYALHKLAAETGCGPHALHDTSPIAQTQSYAFHFSAAALANWFRDLALAAGANDLTGRVQCASRNDRGHVSAVHLDDGRSIDGDFFIDCSGFDSVLLHRTLGDPFISWNHLLLCDRAAAVRLPASSLIPPFTTSRALPAGWMWHIPLASSQGLGYVFSSSFASDDDAWQHMLAAAPGLESSGAQPRFLAMRVGRQTHFWKDNVLAIGLSAAFVEPLESTGLHLTQAGLQTFLQRLPHGHDWRAVRDSYNRRMGALCDHVRDFIQLHYHLSRRSDSAFWNAARSAPLSDELVGLLRLYDDAGILDLPRADIFPDTSWYHILTGNDRLPRRADRLSLAAPHSAVRQTLAAIDEQNRLAVSQLPRHEDLLPLWRRGPLARAS